MRNLVSGLLLWFASFALLPAPLIASEIGPFAKKKEHLGQQMYVCPDGRALLINQDLPDHGFMQWTYSTRDISGNGRPNPWAKSITLSPNYVSHDSTILIEKRDDNSSAILANKSPRQRSALMMKGLSNQKIKVPTRYKLIGITQRYVPENHSVNPTNFVSQAYKLYSYLYENAEGKKIAILHKTEGGGNSGWNYLRSGTAGTEHYIKIGRSEYTSDGRSNYLTRWICPHNSTLLQYNSAL